MRIGIVGFGYTGRPLALGLLEAGEQVVGVARSPERWAGTAREGFEGRVADLDAPDTMRQALEDVDRVVHLAPPPREGVPEEQAAIFARTVPRGCDRIVYGSTTGVFEVPEDPAEWVDEEWPTGPHGGLGRARLAYERALAEHAACPVYLVRIAGIYGPGRTLVERLEAGRLQLVEGGRFTSRVHRDDLARMLQAMVLDPAPPPLLLACDDCPAPTLEVARFTADLVGLSLPPTMSAEAADAASTPMARAFRRGAKRCRSIYREALIGPLRYPSYREGVTASLASPDGKW